MLSVKWLFKFKILWLRLSDGSLLLMLFTYKSINQVREYWYIGSMFASSDIQKNKMDPCTATGL